MKQPTKDALREQLALAADEIIRLREDLALTEQDWAHEVGALTATGARPWWRRWFA